jgi:hypothetical protein
MTRLPWFEDFNDYAVAPAAAEDPPLPPDDTPDPRIEAWTEGFLAGCRAARADTGHQSRAVAAELSRRVAGIEDNLAAIADQSAATMGGLLLDLLAASAPPGLPAERLAEIVAAIRPIFALEPRLHISPAVPGEVSFHDLLAIYTDLGSGDCELAIRWHQPGADLGPQVLAQAIGAHESDARPAGAAGTEAVPPGPDEG